MKPSIQRGALWGALALAFSGAQADAPSQEELWQLLKEQQAQIEALRAELAETRQLASQAKSESEAAKGKADQTDEALEETVAAVDEVIRSAGAASEDRTHIGGYGELHINGGDADEIDFHRFVLFFDHEFDERTRFVSELELEHSLAGDGKPGEVELEQAYIERTLSPTMRGRAGLFLIPVGILNETHEPPTFYGVERNSVESRIIPTTWWEGGASLHGEFAPGWSWDVAAHSGLATSAASGYAPRSGRRKVAEAPLEDLAYTGRVRYTGTPGLELGASLQYQADITQSADPDAGSATLFETHAVYQRGDFGLRALYARWDLDGTGPEAIGADEQEGFYIEPSYRLSSDWGIFARYAQWDNAAGDDIDSEFSQTHIGFNYFLNSNVVLKADYQFEDRPAGGEDDRINLGVGYQF